MATSVANRRFNFIEPTLNDAVYAFEIGANPTFRSNSPVQPVNLEPISVIDDDSSSEDEEDYSDVIRKVSNSEVEPPIHDPRDEGTADNWIQRNQTLVRLTGKHPFNSEPPLARLMEQGFITPVPLHYVRNHGAVPKATWQDWSIEICGLVKKPTQFTMDQLVNEFPSREFPVTLVCAGNRRKEQNMVKRTKGFNWGPGAISTTVWHGVPLRLVLKRCGILTRKEGALNVCFEGAENLPGGSGSKYGTSIKIEYAMDPARDIIIAYKQNGAFLTPDHGFPARIIMPGFIGGRMVKWLTKITVTTKESNNYYHNHDNKVFPSRVDQELANTQAWWNKPEYVINELNINSVITTPSHEEILPINSWTTQRPYTLKGYAYSGGGRKVTRVEITLDGGARWQICKLEHTEKPNKYGKYWCWCFWSLDVEVLDLLSAKEIAVRAWDETFNTQPEKLNWNLMGMMNNCWFRIKTNICKSHKGEIGMVFEHPTVPGNKSGGWMAKEKQLEKDDNQTMKKSVSTPFMKTSTKTFFIDEVKKHNSADNAWVVVHDHVYDCTRFLKDHPGGLDSILINAGSDCTEEFDSIHSDKAKSMLEELRIGELVPSGSYSSTPTRSEVVPRMRSVALVPREKIPCKLIKKLTITHDVRLLRFGLSSEKQKFGLPVGKHIYLCATIDGKLCMRAYTPISTIDEIGYFDLLIKIYFKNPPLYSNGGLMSQYLDSLEIGSTIEVKGPLGHIEYVGRGKFLVNRKQKYAKKLAMIAGGSGITPIYQVIQAILKDPDDETEMYLVHANRTEDDILLRPEIDSWAKEDERLKIWYVVSRPVKGGWDYSVGRISENILREHVPDGLEESLALACGPPQMIESVKGYLEKMNYDINESILVF